MSRCFERDNETVNISTYGFEYYIDNTLVKCGLVDDVETTIEILICEGFCEVL